MNTTSEQLQLDSTLIQQWLEEGIDYNQEFYKNMEKRKETNTTVPDNSELSGFLAGFFKFLSSEPMRYFSSFLLITLVATAVIVVVTKKFSSPEKFKYNTDEEDNIYGIDFDKDLADAQRTANHYQCIRLTYLKLLRYLQDGGMIHWLPGKTVTQYTQEMKLDEFRRITLLFVRIRYGNYTATADMAEEAISLSNIIRNHKAVPAANTTNEKI